VLLFSSKTPQDHRPSGRTTDAGGEVVDFGEDTEVSSMTAGSDCDNAAVDAESAGIGKIVSNFSSAASVTAAAAAARVVPVSDFGCSPTSPTRPQTQTSPGKVTGYSGLAWLSFGKMSNASR